MGAVNQKKRVLAIVGHTASGKSSLAISVAQHLGGEIVSCDSTAVYRGFDIGTDKVPASERGGVPHHLIDVVEPTELYSAARYSREAVSAIHRITKDGKLPIVVGGSGLYYRALTRGLFDGPGRDDVMRRRLTQISLRRGAEYLHRMVSRVDPDTATRVHPRDEKRLIRALEVYFLTRLPLSKHFLQTRSPLEGYQIVVFGLRLASNLISSRIAKRVDQQFSSGLLQEVRGLLARGVPVTAHPFSGLVYRQVLEHFDGIRHEEATRALIVKENQKYARRQLIWFRKEPNLEWINRPGEDPETLEKILCLMN